MRGDDQQLQSGMFSYVSLEQRVPQEHPLRAVRKLVDQVLKKMSKEFDRLYAEVGRPSIPPERLLRALLLQVFYSIRSERLLMEQLDYNLLFRWFVGLEIDDKVWNPTVYTKNRDRLLNQEVAQSFFSQVKEQAAGLMSDEHFTVDGTLIEAWASHKSFRRKDQRDGGPDAGKNFHGEKRRNDTHASKTDPESRLYKKAAGQARPVELSGAHGGGESERVGGGGDGHAGRWDGRTRRGTVDGGGADEEKNPSDHARRRQGLRRERLCKHGARTGSDAARDAEQHQPAERHR